MISQQMRYWILAEDFSVNSSLTYNGTVNLPDPNTTVQRIIVPTAAGAIRFSKQEIVIISADKKSYRSIFIWSKPQRFNDKTKRWKRIK
jgi:hypothetical protein